VLPATLSVVSVTALVIRDIEAGLDQWGYTLVQAINGHQRSPGANGLGIAPSSSLKHFLNAAWLEWLLKIYGVEAEELTLEPCHHRFENIAN